MTVWVKNKSTSFRPAEYASPVSVEWDFGPGVRKVVQSVNELPPSVSEYIAYDTLVPPNPFIAVTQDGAGNVCYDGGFPKFYNNSAPTAEVNTFAQLKASFKYLYNVLKFIANKQKFAAGNRKVLILGDANQGETYNIKDITASNFNLSLSAMTRISLSENPDDKWEFTYKTRSDYVGGLLNPTLAELEEYVCCVFFSTRSGSVPLITESGVADIVTYRTLGSGLFFITDHGVNLATIEEATLPSAVGFFITANKVIVNFGAWFTGNFNRVPVNVGFLRETYGDHPLYNGMTNAESISAGGSESKVSLSELSDLIDPPDFPPTLINKPGINNVNFLLLGNSGELITVKYVYLIGSIDLLNFKSQYNAPLKGSVDVGFNTSVILKLELDGSKIEGTIKGFIYRNDKVIGEFESISGAGSSVEWYAGAGTPIYVNNGDEIRAAVTVPFYTEEVLTVVRLQPNLDKTSTLAGVIKKLRPIVPASTDSKAIKATIARINTEHIAMQATSRNSENVRRIRNFMSGNYDLPEAKAYIYNDPVSLGNALQVPQPPTPRQIFDSWDRIRNDEYYPKGLGIPAGNEALAWTWDEALQTPTMPLNTGGHMGFISDESVEYYDHEVTIKSTNGDDDGNGLILAFSREGTINHQLVVMLCCDYTNNANLPYAANITVFYKGPTIIPLFLNNDDNMAGGWGGKFKRVSVQRRGDVFNLKFSLWNSTVYAPALNITFNLNEFPQLLRFKGPKQYGYYNHSQPSSFFLDIAYSGGLLHDLVIDVQNNQVYKYKASTGWTVLAGVKPHDIYGSPRVLANPDGPRYKLNRDGTITVL